MSSPHLTRFLVAPVPCPIRRPPRAPRNDIRFLAIVFPTTLEPCRGLGLPTSFLEPSRGFGCIQCCDWKPDEELRDARPLHGWLRNGRFHDGCDGVRRRCRSGRDGEASRRSHPDRGPSAHSDAGPRRDATGRRELADVQARRAAYRLARNPRPAGFAQAAVEVRHRGHRGVIANRRGRRRLRGDL